VRRVLRVASRRVGSADRCAVQANISTGLVLEDFVDWPEIELGLRTLPDRCDGPGDAAGNAGGVDFMAELGPFSRISLRWHRGTGYEVGDVSRNPCAPYQMQVTKNTFFQPNLTYIPDAGLDVGIASAFALTLRAIVLF